MRDLHAARRELIEDLTEVNEESDASSALDPIVYAARGEGWSNPAARSRLRSTLYVALHDALTSVAPESETSGARAAGPAGSPTKRKARPAGSEQVDAALRSQGLALTGAELDALLLRFGRAGGTDAPLDLDEAVEHLLPAAMVGGD